MTMPMSTNTTPVPISIRYSFLSGSVNRVNAHELASMLSLAYIIS